MKKKKLYSDEYQALLALLRETRKAAGKSQVEMAAELGVAQSFVSKCERGERRVDLIDLLRMLRVMGAAPDRFLAQLQERFPPRSDARSESDRIVRRPGPAARSRSR